MKRPKEKKASIDLLECKTVSVFITAKGSRRPQACRNREFNVYFDKECVHVRKEGKVLFFFLIQNSL